LAGIFIDEAHIKLSYKKVSLSLFILAFFLLVLPRWSDSGDFSAHLPSKSIIYMTLYFAVGIVLILYFLTFFIKTGRLNDYPLQAMFLLLFLAEPFYWGAQIKRPDRYDPYFQHIPAFIHYLKNDNGIYRIFSTDGILYPNISTAYEIFDIRWLDALIPRRAYDFTIRFANSKEPATMRFTGTSYPILDEMFNLLNVKYVLTQNYDIKDTNNCSFTSAPQPYFGRDTLNQLISQQNQGKKNFFTQLPMNINGVNRMSIFAQPPDKFDVVISVPEQSSSLDFSIGLNPQVFQSDRGDGVDFTIRVIDNLNNRHTLFTKYIDPKNNPCERKWFDESVSLNQWAGKKIILRFITDAGPKGNVSWDWAYWGDIGLSTAQTSQTSKQTSQELTSESPYEIVHQDSAVRIFQNKVVYPRAFVVHDLISVHSFNQALDSLANSAIDLRQTAIVENFPADLRTLTEKSVQKSLSGSADVKRITPDRLSVETKTDSPGLLVVSEQYYPGWRAYVDGKETHVYAVDGILRGVFLSKGRHTVIFEYKPISFLIGLVVSIVSLLMTITRLAYLYKKSNHRETLTLDVQGQI
jgi:Bacterial membrane protein YfhO